MRGPKRLRFGLRFKGGTVFPGGREKHSVWSSASGDLCEKVEQDGVEPDTLRDQACLNAAPGHLYAERLSHGAPDLTSKI
jgi:hypothetical protein